MGARRRLLVDVERLGIETRREGLDLLRRERVPAELHLGADLDIVEVFHDAFASRRAIIMGVVSVITGRPV